MRERWARWITTLTGLLVLLLSVTFSLIQNQDVPLEVTESKEQAPSAGFLAPEDIETGRQMYQQLTCMRCHSIAGRGNPRYPLDGVGAKHNAESLRNWIIGANALQGVLPERAFKQKQAYRKLSSDDLDALVIYLQTLRPATDRK